MPTKVLIVDDEREVLELIEKSLSRAGYEVAVADNGADAVNLAKNHKPDVIVLDIVMPGMDGGEVAEALGDMPATKNIPIIFLTGLVVSEQEIERHAEKGRFFMAKPCRVERLIKAIDKCAGVSPGGGGNMGFLANFFKNLMLEAKEDQ